MLTGDERCAPGSAALLGVVIGETQSLLGDAVDIGCLVAHQPVRITTEVSHADIVAPDHDDVWFGTCSGSSHLDLLSLVGWFRKCLWVSAARRVSLGEAQQHGKEREQAYKEQDDRDRNDGRLLSLFGDAGEWGVRFAPQITNTPPVLPNRSEERQDATCNQ